MKAVTQVAKAIYASPRVRAEAFDLVKIIAAVVAAHFGIKFA